MDFFNAIDARCQASMILLRSNLFCWCFFSLRYNCSSCHYNLCFKCLSDKTKTPNKQTDESIDNEEGEQSSLYSDKDIDIEDDQEDSYDFTKEVSHKEVSVQVNTFDEKNDCKWRKDRRNYLDKTRKESIARENIIMKAYSYKTDE